MGRKRKHAESVTDSERARLSMQNLIDSGGKVTTIRLSARAVNDADKLMESRGETFSRLIEGLLSRSAKRLAATKKGKAYGKR